MKFTLALTLDKNVQFKYSSIIDLFKDIDKFVQSKNYGNELLECLIICKIINPPNGYEHLFKDFKPKFIELKSVTNKLTGETLLIERQFSYSIKISGELFTKFLCGTEKESKKIIAKEILNSLLNLDLLPKKVKDFNKETFKSDMDFFFKEQNLIE
jgi:hypothetical protein